jgi:hypothetical protein
LTKIDHESIALLSPRNRILTGIPQNHGKRGGPRKGRKADRNKATVLKFTGLYRGRVIYLLFSRAGHGSGQRLYKTFKTIQLCIKVISKSAGET